VLAAVSGLEELLRRGRPGDQVSSDALAVGEDDAAWVLFFVLQEHGVAIVAPVAGVDPDRLDEVARRCNEHNAALGWTVLSCAPWDGDQVVSLSARVPLAGDEDALWGMLGTGMQFVLEQAGPVRGRFEDLLEDGGA